MLSRYDRYCLFGVYPLNDELHCLGSNKENNEGEHDLLEPNDKDRQTGNDQIKEQQRIADIPVPVFISQPGQNRRPCRCTANPDN
ncbi:hypothetical protein D3C80_1608180 [compost metagenome]